MALTHNLQQESDSIYFGNCLLFAGRYTGAASDFSSSNLVNLGLKRSVEYEPITETIQPEFDDGEFNDIIDTEQARLSVELTELVAEKLALLSGGTQFVKYVLGTQVVMSTAYDTITMSSTKPVRLSHRSYTTSAPVQVTAITVKEDTDTDPETYVADTDYVISGPDLMGYTTITRKSSSTSIVEGQKVRVAYTYTPAKIISLRRGGATEIQPIVLRVIHVKRIDSSNLIYGLKLDLVKAYFNKMSRVAFTSDKEKKQSWGIPYEFLGKLDNSRALTDGQVDLIDTLKGVTLTDLNMQGMADLDLAILKNAAVTV